MDPYSVSGALVDVCSLALLCHSLARWIALAKFSASCKIANMPTQQLDYFSTLVAEDEHFPLTEASIAVAQHAFPDLDVQHVLDEIDQFGDRLKKRISADASAVQRLQQLKHFFYTELGFGPNPNDFYAPENSYIHHVLQSRWYSYFSSHPDDGAWQSNWFKS